LEDLFRFCCFFLSLCIKCAYLNMGKCNRKTFEIKLLIWI